ncbi:MAG TPA: DUF4157 domain-containing protein [Actinomycetota bacterium]|nr:DUF4157 domain-containing protein [Actinomycetota bacterium]
MGSPSADRGHAMRAMQSERSAGSRREASAPLRPLLRRCCGRERCSGDCARDDATLLRAGLAPPTAGRAPAIVHDVLRTAGEPLEPGARADMEKRLGHDFARVRVHRDAAAGESARAVGALAYTVGEHVVFAPGQYETSTPQGRSLLAHELTHVVQDGGAAAHARPELEIAPDDGAAESEARRNAAAARGPAEPRPQLGAPPVAGPAALRRALAIDGPSAVPAGAPAGTTKEKIVDGYVKTLCPEFEAKGGKVQPRTAAFCPTGVAKSSSPTACECLCEMHGIVPTWTISVNDSDWPHTDPATRTVTVHSPFSGLAFGAWTAGASAHRGVEPNWLVLGHELCGHALLMVRGTHPTGPAPTHGGRPSHDETVKIENKIAAEHGVPASELRGLFADPHHGESFARVTIGQFPSGSSDVTLLPASERRQLDIAEAFAKSAPVLMDVVGHTDATGSAGANTTVSKARAAAVRAELVSRGIAAANFLLTDGVGATQCASPGADPACRKVEIFMFINRGASATHP